MGAGQIGGIATMLDIDFKNAAGFEGVDAQVSEGQFITHFLSHALMFCVGTLIEAHVVLTPAICVYGERYKFQVFAGTHKFLRHAGVQRIAQHVCIHKDYNHTLRGSSCSSFNLALLVLNKQFSFHHHEAGADFVINRLRYGVPPKTDRRTEELRRCRYFGWGSRRNGYLLPLLIDLRKMDVVVLPSDRCFPLWNVDDKFLCIQQLPCKSEKYGALCPDDLGSIVECSGYAFGMQISRLVDRPCGVGFLDLAHFNKFLTCGVDDAREIIDHDAFMEFELTSSSSPRTPRVITVPSSETESEVID